MIFPSTVLESNLQLYWNINRFYIYMPKFVAIVFKRDTYLRYLEAIWQNRIATFVQNKR